MVYRNIKKIKIIFFIICLMQIFYLFHYRSGFNFNVFKDSFNQNSGIEYSVSEEVVESDYLIKNQKIINFNLSDKLKKDKYFYQRFIELNYPIRLDQSSRYIFFLKDEIMSENCEVLGKLEKIKLAKC